MAMLSKHLIEAPVPPSQRRPDLGLPPTIDQLVLAAMAKEPGRRPPTMEQYGEQIAALAATLPPLDGSRSRSQSVASPVNAVTPAAPSAFAALTPQATPWTPPPIPPTTRANPPPVARTRSRAPIYAIACALVVGGGAAIYVGTRTPATQDGQGSAVPPPPTPDPGKPDPWNGQTPPVDTAGPDPWGASTSGAAPVHHETDVGTAETPVPSSARLIVPSNWTRFSPDQKSYGYVDPNTGTLVAIGPLFAGTNDPRQQSAMWTQATGAAFSSMSKIYSAGAMRDAAGFTATLDGVAVIQIIVYYPTKRYRVGVIYQAPALVATQAGFEDTVKAFFAKSVKLP
jgi:hypothetical protein